MFDVMFGGARGGGKTDACIGDWIHHQHKYGAGARGLFFRRTLKELEAVIDRTREIFPMIGAKFNEQKKRWTFPNGAVLGMAYLERVADAGAYQGHNYTRLYFEELTNWATPVGIDRLVGTLRSARGVPVGLRSTANPGGPGHAWVKGRYIDPAPLGYRVLLTERGQRRMFIPSKVTDNRILMDNDPDYVNRLYLVGSEQLVRAWLTGDWNIVEGAFFDCWRAERHVIRPIPLPSHWVRFRSMDVGSANPFHVGWWAICSETIHHPDGVVIPRGALILYREWYGAKKVSDTYQGLKLTAQQVADGIVSREAEEITYSVIDPSAFKEEGAPSYVEQMCVRQPKLVFQKADNTRVQEHGKLGGWSLVRQRLIGDGDGHPMLVVFSTCVDTIRTLPILQHSILHPEDLDSDMEDHAADSVRYACASRPWAAPTPSASPPIDSIGSMTLDDLWTRETQRSNRI